MSHGGSIGDYLGKDVIKVNAKLARKAKDTLHFDSRIRLSKEDAGDQVFSTDFQNEGNNTSKNCSDQDMTAQTSL